MKIYRLSSEQIYLVKPGRYYWFEYHCYEGRDSSDAELWYRSHSRIMVLSIVEEGCGIDEKERGKNGQPAVFKIKFEDGFIYDAFEDEIVSSKNQFFRPDPPKRIT